MQYVYRQPWHVAQRTYLRRTHYPSYKLLLPFDPASEQQITAAAGPYDAMSIFDANSASGNIAIIPLKLSPSNADLFMGTDGIPYTDDVTSGRQYFQYREFDITDNAFVVATGAADGITATYYINDVTPTETAVIPDQTWYEDIAITPIILGDYVSDADDAEHLISYSGTLPAGISIQQATYNSGQPNERIVKQIEGTPTSLGSGSITLTATDIAGAQLTLTTFDYEVLASVTVPTVDTGSTSLADAQADLIAAGLIGIVIPEVNSATVGNVFNQDPEGGTIASPGANVVLYVSGVEVPDVMGDDKADAETELTAAGLIPQSTYKKTVTDVPDTVIEQAPTGESVVLPDSIVQLTIARAYPVSSVKTISRKRFT